MNDIAKILKPQPLLRVGLAFVFIYAAVSSLIAPQDWVGYLPSILIENFDTDLLLKGFSVAELGLAGWLLSGVYVRYAALLATAMLLGIVVSTPNLLIITFRDIGLVFAALALAFMDQPDSRNQKAKR